MKISSLQENLKNGLSIVNQIAGKNVNLPILNNILIKAREDGIQLIATDLEVGVISMIRGKIEEEGDFTVESKIISDYIALLPNKKIDIELKENSLNVRCDNYKTTINGQGAEDFPLIPTIERDVYFKADIDLFKKALAQVLFATSNSETRVELTGVFFDFDGEQLVLAATDSYRLAEKKLKIGTNNKDIKKKIIVPAKTLQHLLKILSSVRIEDLSNENKEIQFYISENQILFIVGQTELISRLIDGQYPDYKQIIPINFSTKAIVAKNELLRAVKAAAIFSKTGTNDINIDLPAGANKLIITSVSNQAGENISELDIEMTGQDNGVVLNHRYLLDGINNITSDNIVLNISDSNTPCVITAEKEGDYLYVIMPIKQ
jgi:DNA polymerase-3 subunit beta